MFKYTTIAFATISTLTIATAHSASIDEVRALEPQTLFSTIDPILEAPTLKEPDVTIFTSGAHYYKQALTSTKPQIITSEKFVPLSGSKSSIIIPPGASALVNLTFTAESRCSEPDSNMGNWCEVSIQVDGQEASPKASTFGPDTYAFDSTDTGTESPYSWESHAMDRHICVTNKSTTEKKVVPVNVFWKVTNFDGGAAPSFWLDDWSFTIQLAKGCRQTTSEF